VHLITEQSMPRYKAALAIHCSLFHMSSRSFSEDVWKLSYTIRPLNRSAKTNYHREIVIVISLVFLPNTRQLADIRVEGLEALNMAIPIDSYVRENDVSGFIWHVLSRARYTLIHG